MRFWHVLLCPMGRNLFPQKSRFWNYSLPHGVKTVRAEIAILVLFFAPWGKPFLHIYHTLIYCSCPMGQDRSCDSTHVSFAPWGKAVFTNIPLWYCSCPMGQTCSCKIHDIHDLVLFSPHGARFLTQTLWPKS